MIGEVQDRRPMYAEKMRELAEIIMSTPKQPKGLVIHLMWHDGETTVIQKDECETNCMEMAGAMFRSAMSYAMTPPVRVKEIPT